MRQVDEAMTTRGWLIVGLRLLGAWIFWNGFGYLTSYVDFKVLKLTAVSNSLNPTSYLFNASCDFALAYAFAVGAPCIADWCGPADREKAGDPVEVP